MSASTTPDLELEEYRRYGRQMILPEIGKDGQRRLKSSSVLVVGAGGLGCPAIAYLAGAGVGKLGIIDDDVISLSNVHRQILYTPSQGKTHKVSAAATFIKSLNDHVDVVPFMQRLAPDNVESVFRHFDVVLDCTDNQSTRYLISDACVLLDIPLVSGSALKTEGQLAIYNYLGGPCYRCIFPAPTPPELVESCGNAGILGPVVGVIGVLQALETIKLITRDRRLRHEKANGGATVEEEEDQPEHVCTLTLFSAFADVPWRTIKLRKRAQNCKACGAMSTMSFTSIKESHANESAQSTLLDGTDRVHSQLGGGGRRLEAHEVKAFNGLILDVRSKTQYEISSLPHSINVPMENVSEYAPPPDVREVLVVCRNGVDSRVAAKQMGEKFSGIKFADLNGGLASYASFDQTFPFC